MSIRLTVRQRSEANAPPTEVVLDDPSVVLGRDKGCQVVLAQQAVSRTHARISRDGPLFFLEDLGSAFGTEINGKKLPKGEKRLLRNGDVIAIAQFDVTFDRIAEAPKEGQSDKTGFIARSVVKDAMRGLSKGEGPYFRMMNGKREGERIELADAQELVFGRDETADVMFKGDDLISRRHAKVRRDWSGTHVEDLESRNGIKVNKKKVQRKTLKDRDEVEIGGVRLLYLDPSEVREAALVRARGRGRADEQRGPRRGGGGRGPRGAGRRGSPRPPPGRGDVRRRRRGRGEVPAEGAAVRGARLRRARRGGRASGRGRVRRRLPRGQAQARRARLPRRVRAARARARDSACSSASRCSGRRPATRSRSAPPAGCSGPARAPGS